MPFQRAHQRFPRRTAGAGRVIRQEVLESEKISVCNRMCE